MSDLMSDLMSDFGVFVVLDPCVCERKMQLG